MMRTLRLACLALLTVALCPAQFFGGGGVKQYDKATWVICNGAPCAAAADVTNHYIAVAAGKLQTCYVTAKTPPTGSSLTLDVLNNGVSVFGVQPLLTIPAGGTGVYTASAFDAPNLSEADVLRLDIKTVGGTFAGQDLTIVCKYQTK